MKINVGTRERFRHNTAPVDARSSAHRSRLSRKDDYRKLMRERPSKQISAECGTNTSGASGDWLATADCYNAGYNHGQPSIMKDSHLLLRQLSGYTGSGVSTMA